MASNAFSKLLLLSLAIVSALATRADEPVEILRPVTAAYTVELGRSHIADTYLTPLKYEGLAVALSYERMQAMKFSPEKWVMQLSTSLQLDHDENPARNAVMWAVDFEASWAMMRRINLQSLSGLSLYAGCYTGVDLGALYLARNGNNPISAKASWTVGITGAAAYNFKISRLPICVRYQPSLPVTGVFFSPDYGELYYEIYLGNHSNLAHAAWWGNYFRLNNLLTADLRLGSTNLRVGYRADIFSSKVNNITTRNITHSFVFGLSGQWLSMPRSGKISPNAKTISAIY